MLNISRTSWHFRFLSFMDDIYNVGGVKGLRYGTTGNLCQYMRSLVYAIFVAVFTVSVVLAWIPMNVTGWYMAVHYGSPSHWPDYAGWAKNVWVGLSFLAWFITNASVVTGAIVLAGLGGVFLQEKYEDWRFSRLPDAPVAKKQPGIFVLWYRAFKEKVCPMLTLTN